jgi:PEP-CTERM motif-containing protein
MSSIFLGAPAHAQITDCSTVSVIGAFLDFGFGDNTCVVDYTVPATGGTEDWSFGVITRDPFAYGYLQSPNEVFAITQTYLGGGIFSNDEIFDFPYTWEEGVKGKNVYLTVGAPADFDNCDDAPVVGAICAAQYNVWGNGVGMIVYGSSRYPDEPASFGGLQPVPEPESWALIVAGLGAAGAALRGRRRIALS